MNNLEQALELIRAEEKELLDVVEPGDKSSRQSLCDLGSLVRMDLKLTKMIGNRIIKFKAGDFYRNVYNSNKENKNNYYNIKINNINEKNINGHEIKHVQGSIEDDIDFNSKIYTENNQERFYIKNDYLDMVVYASK